MTLNINSCFQALLPSFNVAALRQGPDMGDGAVPRVGHRGLHVPRVLQRAGAQRRGGHTGGTAR
jgi:hypothetical protein